MYKLYIIKNNSINSLLSFQVLYQQVVNNNLQELEQDSLNLGYWLAVAYLNGVLHLKDQLAYSNHKLVTSYLLGVYEYVFDQNVLVDQNV